MFLSVLILLVTLATLVLTGLIYRHLRAQPERRAVRPTWSQADVPAVPAAPPSLDAAPKEPAKKWAPSQPDAAAPSAKQEDPPAASRSNGGDGATKAPGTPFLWKDTTPSHASPPPEAKEDDDEGFAWL